MVAPLPDSARINVSQALANDLFRAAERITPYDNKAYYDPDLQTLVQTLLRESCTDGFDGLADQVKTRLAQWPYCVLVQGLRFDEQNRVFVGINRAFGTLVARPYEKPRAQLVHYIQPATDRPASRGSQYESEKLHTDTADWDPPVKLISMVCVRPDAEGGGRSRVLDVDTLRDEVKTRLGEPALDRLETEPVPWLLAPYRGGSLQWRTILSRDHICWRRYTIDLAVESMDSELSAEIAHALDEFEQVVATAAGTIEFSMCEGDLLFTDNHRTIHARTPIASGNDSDRLMIRSWVQVAESA